MAGDGAYDARWMWASESTKRSDIQSLEQTVAELEQYIDCGNRPVEMKLFSKTPPWDQPITLHAASVKEMIEILQRDYLTDQVTEVANISEFPSRPRRRREGSKVFLPCFFGFTGCFGIGCEEECTEHCPATDDYAECMEAMTSSDPEADQSSRMSERATQESHWHHRPNDLLTREHSRMEADTSQTGRRHIQSDCPEQAMFQTSDSMPALHPVRPQISQSVASTNGIRSPSSSGDYATGGLTNLPRIMGVPTYHMSI